MEGQRLGERFEVEREVGRGGVGVVYRARDLETGKTVALKVVAAEAGMAPEEEERLMREGRVLQELDHPGIVKVISSGVLPDTSQPYLAMEWLEGEDLAARQAREPLSLGEAVELTMLVARALAAAHAAGVVHRDIKPGNIFLVAANGSSLTSFGAQPKLVDFGVAKSDDMRVTQAGDIVGTPAYMSPEQARGDATVDARSDIYSLGATLFELITRRPPHVGPSHIATLARLVTTAAPRLSEIRPEIPAALDDLVYHMLATSPGERPENAEQLSKQLEESLADAQRVSIPPGSTDLSLSQRLGSSASRLVTSIVAINFSKGSSRERALELLRSRGADAVPLGQDAIVAHLGARRAVGTEASAALDLGRRLARSGARVGVASGRARVNVNQDSGAVKPVGEVVDRASSLAREAELGQVLADATTAELGRGRYEFRSRDDGSSVVGEVLKGGQRVGGAPFVGRDRELNKILTTFERAREDRTPVVVSVTGPPGIGKSRLRREVLARLSGNTRVILQRSDAYGQGHALGAAADVVRGIIGLSKGTTTDEARATLDARLLDRTEINDGARDLIARMLANQPLPEGIDPRGARDLLWLAMTDLVMGVVRAEATIVVLEDTQWADPESVEFIDHLLGRAGGQPLMVLLLVRPEFWDHSDRLAGRDHTRIELRPLSRLAAEAIARALLGDRADELMLERIAQQSAGLPLFAEELSRLAASGRDTTHAPTIEAAIQVSMDALSEECRDALGRLSVFGTSCWDAGLEAMNVGDAESLMRELAGTEVLVEQATSRFSDAREWVFKHALVREVAYESLSEEARRELHALAADWLASMGEDAATVAGHYDRGGQHEKAASHWERAAQRALATNALTDALQMAERALAFADDRQQGFRRAMYLDEAWARLDPRASDRETSVSELESNVYDEASQVRAEGARARFDAARGSGMDITERLLDVRDRAASLGLHDEEARCSAAAASRLAFAGQFAPAEEEAARLLALTNDKGILGAAVDAWQTLAILRQTLGQLSAALDARRNAVRAAQRAGLKEREAMLTTNLGFALTTIGARKEARNSLEAGLALADAIGSRGAVRHAQMNLLGFAATFGGDKRLDAHLAEPRADADADATGVWTSPDRSNLGVLFYRGWELIRNTGDTSCGRARSLLQLAAEGYQASDNRDVLPVALGVWGEAERRCGNLKRALELTRRAVELLESGAHSLLNESTVYLALHDVCAEQGDEEGARDAVRRGLPHLERRLKGLQRTSYANLFLSELPDNAGLLGAAESYGLVPDSIQRVLERGVS